MGISEAIARVRKSAKKANIEGALASFGAGLHSTAIPSRLRPAASRIASLLGATVERQRELPSIERTLDGQQLQGPSPHAVHAAGEVCPFTGLRPDGTVDGGPAVSSEAVSSEASRVADTGGPQVSIQDPAIALEPSGDATHTVATPAKPAAKQAAKPRSTPPPEPAPSKRADPAPRPAAPKYAGAEAMKNEKAAPAEKAKEKLAGEPPAAKASARSATKPAAKQTNGKANQRKK